MLTFNKDNNYLYQCIEELIYPSFTELNGSLQGKN